MPHVVDFGRRTPRKILSAPFKPHHYRALAGMMRVYENFPVSLARYLFRSGEYPAAIAVRTPTGRRLVQTFSSDDFFTVNEVFCRRDYEAPDDIRLVVDFGANIGVTAAYFLSRNDNVRVHLFEPVPRNLERLRQNLAQFDPSRYVIHETAVGLQDGEVSFGVEDTGRYGGIGLEGLETSITVPCANAAAVLAKIVAEDGPIDILKIDVEGLEEAIIDAIPPETSARIKCIYAECNGKGAPPPGFVHSQYGTVARYYNRQMKR